MDNYKNPYLRLFNGITDALSALEAGDVETAKAILRQAQIDAEDLYIGEA